MMEIIVDANALALPKTQVDHDQGQRKQHQTANALAFCKPRFCTFTSASQPAACVCSNADPDLMPVANSITVPRGIDLILPMPADLQLRQLCWSVQARLSQRIPLGVWSEYFGVSGKTLGRRFLRETGLSYRVWDMRMRLLSALLGLKRGERITDVALACG